MAEWVYYHPDDYSIPTSGSIVVVQDNEQLRAVDGAFLAARGLRAIIYAGCCEGWMLNPEVYRAYLTDLKERVQRKGISPVGIMVEEEWWDRVNGTVASWACLAGMDMWGRKGFLLPRLRALVNVARDVFGVPVIQVESKWNENTSLGAGLWYPDYGADVLGVDAYLWSAGCPWLGTPPLTPDGGPVMQEKFRREVEDMITGRGLVDGALHYGRPVMVVGQAFHYSDPGQLSAIAPSPVQLQWWSDLASRHVQVAYLAWFCCQTFPEVRGISSLPEVRSTLEKIRSGAHTPPGAASAITSSHTRSSARSPGMRHRGLLSSRRAGSSRGCCSRVRKWRQLHLALEEHQRRRVAAEG